MRLCARDCIPLNPRGAGTGLEGGAIPYLGGVVLDLMLMQKIEMNIPDFQVKVEPGVKKLTLNRKLGEHGFLFGPDPASNPSVGGMASTGGSGLSTLRYGTTKENVVSLTVVTPTGDLLKTRQCVRKSSTGYELTQVSIKCPGSRPLVLYSPRDGQIQREREREYRERESRGRERKIASL